MVNNVIIEGYVTDDCILTQKENLSYCKFSIGYTKKYKEKKESHFFSCVAFGQTAKFMEAYIRKGDLISVVGELEQSKWETNEGQKRSSIGIVCNNVYGLRRKEREVIERGPTDEDLSKQEDVPFNTDDIPF